MKLAVIGAGSTYTPELVSGLMRERERIEVRKLVLHDIDPERLEVVGGLARRMLERQRFSGRFELTGELDHDRVRGEPFGGVAHPRMSVRIAHHDHDSASVAHALGRP